MLIGNLTRDPELRYTPNGVAVCSFGLATNRSWTTEAGEKKEDAEFHRIVAWNKLAELCSQLLTKGRKVFVEGRLQTRSWQGQDGQQRSTTEVVIDDMIILDSRRFNDDASGGPVSNQAPSTNPPSKSAPNDNNQKSQADNPGDEQNTPSEPKNAPSEKANDEVNIDDIPF